MVIDFIDRSIRTDIQYVEFSGATVKVTPIGQRPYTHTVLRGDNARKIIYINEGKSTQKIQAFLADINDAGEIVFVEEVQSLRMLSATNNAHDIDRYFATVFEKGSCIFCAAMDILPANYFKDKNPK